MAAPLSMLGFSLALGCSTSLGYQPDPVSKPEPIEQGTAPIVTQGYSLIGEWELAVEGGRSGTKLIFDPLQVSIDGLAYRYTMDGDSLRLFTEYVDHVGDGNSYGRIAKLTYDSLVVHWREGDVNTYLRTRETKH